MRLAVGKRVHFGPSLSRTRQINCVHCLDLQRFTPAFLSSGL